MQQYPQPLALNFIKGHGKIYNPAMGEQQALKKKKHSTSCTHAWTNRAGPNPAFCECNDHRVSYLKHTHTHRNTHTRVRYAVREEQSATERCRPPPPLHTTHAVVVPNRCPLHTHPTRARSGQTKMLNPPSPSATASGRGRGCSWW